MKRNMLKKIIREEIRVAIVEKTNRDYKDEYKKFQSSDKMKKYRAELNKYNRDKGTYGNGDKKDATHKGSKIVGFDGESKNKGRREKSRLKNSKRKITNEENIKVQVDRGSVHLPQDRKSLQEFGKIWKQIYGKLKKSPDQLPKYKGIIKKVKNSSTTGMIDKLAGIFIFMGKKFSVEVDKSKYNSERPTPWKISYVSNLGENIIWLKELIREIIYEGLFEDELKNAKRIFKILSKEYGTKFPLKFKNLRGRGSGYLATTKLRGGKHIFIDEMVIDNSGMSSNPADYTVCHEFAHAILAKTKGSLAHSKAHANLTYKLAKRFGLV